MTNQYLLHQTAALVGVRGWRIAYAISQGYLPEPEQRFNRQRVFTDEDIARIKKHFAATPKSVRRNGRPMKEAHE